ncbi:MAG: hypothetical protein ACR2HX_23250 [Pyrinomonadaceae bacterium]
MRSTRLKIRTTVFLLFALFAAFAGTPLTAQGQSQKKAVTVPASSLCNQESALEIIKQQMDATRTFDDRVQRIAVLITTADLLWPYQNDKARAAFIEAFDLGRQEFKEKGDEVVREGKGLMADKPDPRYTVINAIAKRDLAWARKLMGQMLMEATTEAKEEAGKGAEQEIKTAEKLFEVAFSLLDSNQAAAATFARSTFRYPATLYLPMFLYRLTARNRQAADQFYQEALKAYANAPMERFLYLSSYPFGNDREAGEMPGYTIYKLPDAFAPSPALQRQFVQLLLRRAQQLVDNPVETPSGRGFSETGQVWLALTNLEKQIAESLPDLAPAAEQARATVYAQLPQNSQRRVGQVISARHAPKKSFDEQVEAAEKNPDVDRRDQQLVFALTGDSGSESLERVLAVVDKISDSSVRQPLLNWLYFVRSQRAVKDKKFEEARKLAAKVEELDQRAHLYLSIAQESLKQNPDQTQAQEMLEEVVASAAKAPPTIVRVRVQLGVAHLYTKLDMNRAIALMGEAVKSINQIDQADFSVQYVTRKIEGKTFGSYANFNTPGFSPETAFQELGKLDFDGMLSQASNLSNKSLRAKTTLALIKPCLQAPPPPAKAKKKP